MTAMSSIIAGRYALDRALRISEEELRERGHAKRVAVNTKPISIKTRP